MRKWALAAAAVLGIAGAGLALDRAFPLPLPAAAEGVVVLAADGTPLRAYPTGDGMWRYRIKPEDVSPRYLEALINYEDRYFYSHPGVNPVAMGRATAQWIANGRIVSGGSTITMQVARILDGRPQRGLAAKARQVLRALQLEAHLSKREILTLYLNHVPMGGIVEGVEMASRAYLGKPASSLTHAEAALLTVLPQSPTRRRPDVNPARAQEARDKVLGRMQALGVWPAAVVREARVEKVIVQHVRGGWLAPLAAERLRRAAGSGSGTVRSTLDAELQSRIESLLLDRVRALPPRISIAVLVMENDSLAVRAYAGSADFADAERGSHVDMVRAARSPGSTLKPFLYALALDQGLIHSESLLVDAPQSFGGYAPGNFQASFSGAVSVSEALARSLNVPAVDLLDRVGPERFASTLRAGGLRLRMEPGATANLSLILGGGSTTLEELVGAYRALAAGGMAGRARLHEGEPLLQSRLMSPEAAWIVREILGGAGGQLAWKTGTSFGFRDAWALGVTDRYTLGVWIGRPDGTPNPGFFGANSAAPLAKEIASFLPVTRNAMPPPPAGIPAQAICWPLGLAREATPAGLCHAMREAWLIDGAAPPTLPDRMREASLRERLLVDARSGERVHERCAREWREVEVAHWPARLDPWLPADWVARSRPPRWRAGCEPIHQASAARTLAIRGLENGSIVRRVPGSTVTPQVVVAAAGSTGQVYWLLDGKLAAAQPAGRSFAMALARDGAHSLTALDDSGRYARVEFVARGFD